MTEAAVRRGRKAKFSDSEVRDRMIQHVTDDVLEHGVTYGLDRVRLDRLLVLAEVPRNAAYSVFSNSSTGRAPQENLRREVVLSLLRGTPGGTLRRAQRRAIQSRESPLPRSTQRRLHFRSRGALR